MINGVMLGLMTACPPIKATRLNRTSPPLRQQLCFFFFVIVLPQIAKTVMKKKTRLALHEASVIVQF